MMGISIKSNFVKIVDVVQSFRCGAINVAQLVNTMKLCLLGCSHNFVKTERTNRWILKKDKDGD